MAPLRTTDNPLRGNPLVSRADVERACRDLLAPLIARHSPGGARVKLGSSGAHFAEHCAELEGFARPLYGIVPLLLGGGELEQLELYRRGLASGTDPDHEEFWGVPGTDQRLVEMAAIGFALAFTPAQFFDALGERVQDNLVGWLGQINRHALVDNNWQFFRVLVNLGLKRVGRGRDRAAELESLERLETHYRGDGYYHDGAPGRVDYYLPWAYHTYGLLYASARGADAERARRYRERARRFAVDFQYWFDAHGAAIPFGRSQTYRFAQASLWGALVFANEEALPWARIKGLYLRHLRYWANLPITRADGVLTLGYAYENLLPCEGYSSPGSPYWAMKYFLALAAPAEHAFWQAEEEPAEALERDLARVFSVPAAGMVFARDATQALFLNAGQAERQWVNGSAKYGKFAYSSQFGFSVAVAEEGPHHAVHDSMLALREPHGAFRVRSETLDWQVTGAVVYAFWQPWPDVSIETLLVACDMPWHLRVHRIRTERALESSERGFALGRDPGEQSAPRSELDLGRRGIVAESGFGTSAIVDQAVRGSAEQRVREARLQLPPPNTSLIWPRTLIPELVVGLPPGVHVLACAVAASTGGAAELGQPPPVPDDLLTRFSRRTESSGPPVGRPPQTM